MEGSIMPKLKYHEYKHQVEGQEMWQHVFKLIDKNDPLRKEIAERYETCMNIEHDEVAEEIFTGSHDVIDINGEKHKKISNANIYTNGGEMDAIDLEKRDTHALYNDDPGFVAFQNKGLDLIKRIKEKYPDSKSHGMLYTFLDMLELNINSVMGEHRGFENTPGENLITNQRKMIDVVLSDKKSIKNWTTLDYNAPEVYEKACKDFGLVKLYSDYNTINKHGLEWSDELNKKKPDPARLREIFKLYEQDHASMSASIGDFEKKFNEDMKLPKDQRQFYNIGHDEEVEKGDFIGDKKRSINWLWANGNVTDFRRKAQNQIFAAELTNLRESIKTEPGDEFADKIDNLLPQLMYEFKGLTSIITPMSDENRVKAILDLKEYASRHKNHPLSEEVLKVCANQLADKHNLDVLSKMEEREAYNETIKTEEDIKLEGYAADKNAFKEYGDFVKYIIEDTVQETIFFLRDDLIRNNDSKSDSYKNLIKEIKNLYKATGTDSTTGEIENTKKIYPKRAFDAICRVIKAADDYHKDHKGISKGVIGRGRDRYNYSDTLSKKLGAKLEKLSDLHSNLPDDLSIRSEALEIERESILEKECMLGVTDSSLNTLIKRTQTNMQNNKHKEAAINKLNEMSNRFAGVINENVTGKPDVDDQEGLDRYLEDQTAALKKQASNILALKTITRSISNNNGFFDNVKIDDNNNTRKAVDDVLSEQFIADTAYGIRKNHAFLRMFDSIKSWEDLDRMKGLALNNGGGGLIDELSKFTKIVSAEENIKNEAAVRNEKNNRLSNNPPQAGVL